MRFLILLGIVAAVVLLWYGLRYRRQARIKQLLTAPLDPSFVSILEKQVTIYAKLPKALRDELHGHINCLS